jgi:hypothetical protein
MYASSSARPSEKGIALVLTLAILVIATILVVGFAASMRTERHAAATMANNEVAGLLSQSAVEHAISILDMNIPQPVPPGASTTNPTNWIINPGLLTTVQGTNAPVQVPLSSNPSASYTSTIQDAQLNILQLSGSGYTVLPTSESMRVAWIPVLKDPSAPASVTNQITGRYAFWIDDEGAKININTAYGKPSTLDFSQLTPGTITVNGAKYPLGHPSSVNLDVLGMGSADLDGLASAVTTQSGLASPEGIKPFAPGGTSDAFLNANKFYLTASSRDPEFNVFGKSRLYLFKQIVGTFQRRLGYPLFQAFRDLDAPMYFHGDEASSADTAALYYTASNLTGIFNRNDWPGMPARSFIEKWGGAAPGTASALKTTAQKAADREADQVAWNVIVMGSFADYGTTYTSATSGEYVNFENKIAAGQPGNTGTVNYPNVALPVGPLSQKAIVPAFPRPLINEVCLTVLLEPNVVSGVTKYRLKVWLQTELWAGPGYPTSDFASTAEEVGLTYLDYSVTQVGNPNTPVAQKDTKYIKSGDPDGIRSLFGAKTTGTLPDNSSPPSRYGVVITQGAAGNPSVNNKWIYVRNGSGFSSSTTGPFNFEPTGMIHMNFKMRLFEHSPAGSVPKAPACSLVPVWDTHDPGTAATNTPFGNMGPATPAVAAFIPPPDDPKDYIEFDFDLDPAALGGQQVTRSLEVSDPRLGGLARAWIPHPGSSDPTNASADTLGAQNQATAGWDTNKLAFVDFSNPTGTGASSSYRPPMGMFSTIPTGMQRGLAGATFKLQPSGSATELPDWLLLDLLAPSVEASNYPNLSFMNSTAGKVNLNAAIYPNGGAFTPPQRWQPLQAVFQNMSGPSTVPIPATSPSTVVTNILNHTLASGTQVGVDFGAVGLYDYPGEVCEILGVADSGGSDWDKEALVRYVASNLTTKSNVFSVWGVAQTVKKNPVNNNAANQGTFELKANGATADDMVSGERRFQAVVERYVWPGNDSIPGQGHVNAGGTYDQLSTGQTLPGNLPAYTAGSAWERIDGPDILTYPVNANSGTWNQNAAASWVSTTIESANNPLRAQMKYRVIYFKFLSD